MNILKHYAKDRVILPITFDFDFGFVFLVCDPCPLEA